jgi:guanylate kinase
LNYNQSKKILDFNESIFIITTKQEKNLRSRGSEDEQSLQNRLSQAIEDNKLSERGVFGLVIVNDNLEIAYKQLKQFISDVINSKYYIKISNKKRSQVSHSSIANLGCGHSFAIKVVL